MSQDSNCKPCKCSPWLVEKFQVWARNHTSLDSFLQTPHILGKFNNSSGYYLRPWWSDLLRIIMWSNALKWIKLMSTVTVSCIWRWNWLTLIDIAKMKTKNTQMKHCQMSNVIFLVKKHVHQQILFKSVRKKTWNLFVHPWATLSSW